MSACRSICLAANICLSFLYLRSVVLSLCMPASCIIVCVYQFVCVIPVKYLKPITCLLVCFSVCVCLSVVSIPLTDCLPAYLSVYLSIYLVFLLFSMRLSICFPNRLCVLFCLFCNSNWLSVYLFVWSQYTFFCLSCLSDRLSVCVPTSLIVRLLVTLLVSVFSVSVCVRCLRE